MKFSLLVALSHLKSRRNEAGISVITLISVVGVMVGVTALIMVLAVMEGFEIDLRDKLLGSTAHIRILQNTHMFPADYESIVEQVEKEEGVVAASPFLYREVMIRSASGASGVVLKGIDTDRASKVTNVAENITKGSDGEVFNQSQRQSVLDNLHTKLKINEGRKNGGKEFSGILIGDELAKLLFVEVGDPIYIVNPISTRF